MRNLAGTGVFLLVLVGFAGCTGASSSTSPTAPSPVSSAPTPPPPPVSGFLYNVGAVLVNASLSGVVFEMTPAGQVPLAGASVYCDACGAFGHTEKITD